MKRIELIENYLDELFPNPKCELNYSKDYELLISVMLSAQTTDKRVNEVTNILYNKYPTLVSLRNADINDLKRKSTVAAIFFVLGYYPIFISFELFFIIATIIGTIPLLIYPPYLIHHI